MRIKYLISILILAQSFTISLFCQSEFSKCPMPQLCREIQIVYDDLLNTPNEPGKISVFLRLIEKSFYKYDCKRSYDINPVPALWLCEDMEKWIDYLSKMDSKEAKKLFGSELFRSVLDGALQEQYFQLSKETEYKLNNPKKLIKYDFELFPYVDENNYKQQMEGFDSICKDIKITASSSLMNIGKISYQPENMIDVNLSTAWVEGVDGYGIKETVKIFFNEDIRIKGLVIKNGYTRNISTWEKNSRVRYCTLYIKGKAKYELNLLNIRDFQAVHFAPIEFKKNEEITLVIEDVYPGTTYKDTAITELYPLISF